MPSPYIRVETELPAELRAAGLADVVALALKPLEAQIRAATPVRTGRLKRSTATKVFGNQVELGWFTDYANLVEGRTGIIQSRVSEAARLALQAVEKLPRVLSRMRGRRVRIL